MNEEEIKRYVNRLVEMDERKYKRENQNFWIRLLVPLFTLIPIYLIIMVFYGK